MKRTVAISALIGMTLIGAAAAQSGGLWVFEPGQVIQASRVNENFATLDRRISVLAGLDELRVQELIDILNRVEPQQLTDALDALNQTQARVSALEAQNVAAIASITLLEETVAALQCDLDALETKVCDQENRLTCVEDKTQFMTVCGTTTCFEGTNVQIKNGGGGTDVANGLGNLILGYNEETGFAETFAVAPERTGSHNLVIGRDNHYTGVGGLLQGILHHNNGSYGAVLGSSNRVGGEFCSVVGGTNNAAETLSSTIAGGRDQTANKHYQWIAGMGGGGLGNLTLRRFTTLGQDPPD